MDSKKKNVNAKFIMYITITILIMAFIFFQSSLPADTSQEESDIIVRFLSHFTDRDAEMLSFIVRKLAHFTEYTLLGLFISLAFKEYYYKKCFHKECFQKTRFYRGVFVIPLICGVLYAVSDEIHQRFVPGRSCELRDVLIDTCGVLLGVIINMLCVRFAKKKDK